MTVPVDPTIATAAAAQNDLARRKLEMDALRKRLRNDPSKEQKLREACEGFESIFVQKMWEQMRATLPKEGYLHSKEEEFWQSMFDQELAKKMTSAGGIGLADMIYEQLSTKLTDASRTTAPSSVRDPVPLKPVSLVPHPAGPLAAAPGTPASGSMYEPANPEAPVAPDGPTAAGQAGQASLVGQAGQAGTAPQPGHDIVQRQLAELERQVASASGTGEGDPAASAGSAAGGAAPSGMPGAVPGVPGDAAGPSAPAEVAAEAGRNPSAMVVSPAQRRTARGKDASSRGLPAAAVPGDNTRKVRSPMRDAQLGPPIVHRTSAMRRVASPASTRPLTVPAGAPSAAEMQAAAAGQGIQDAMSGSAAGSLPGVAPAVSMPAAPTVVPASASQAAPAPAAQASPTGGPSVAAGTPGSMVRPHDGRIASGFGWRNDPITGERAWHPGLDIAVAEGDPVRAAWDGKVVFAGERADYGRLVVLEHPGGWRSFYGHNGSLEVREGDVVRAGTEIAKAGGTGRVAGPHLHFEVRQGELAVNPEYAARSLASGKPAAQPTRPGG